MTNIKISKKEIHLSDYHVAAGDLSNEIGKFFMEKLWNQIEFHRDFNLDKIYFVTMFKKNPTNTNEVNLYLKALRVPLYYLRESTDLWEYDYQKDELKLLWSLPHRTEMKNFLRDPEKYNKDLIRWINKYIKQENINLNDSSAQMLK